MKYILLPLVIISIVVTMGCQKNQTPIADSPSSEALQPTGIGSSGRYQIVFSPHLRADTYLIDTQKGRVWQLTQFTDLPSKPTAWIETDIVDNQGEIGMKYSEFSAQYKKH